MSIETIRVQLEAFCKRFTTELKPFNEALAECTRVLREATDKGRVQAILKNLQDNQHRLKILLDRAQQQHSYLVIFGPLKSGKSTLMNAISGAYVSEVSSLPAYPCLVYVREGDSRGFSTTAFNGDRHEYATRRELQGTLERAHADLAKRIREAEEQERPFNPAQDFDAAIRRIDFTMPAPYLRESGTILVDTPGLYTKMKYNYGQLTRDFRNNAACAVFVVKTDNLFFEPVFEEFTDLLEVFSRVFLVVNIDSSKRDLGPDGKLEPALEQHDPQRIIEAFENLTVNAQIRSAIEAGRLRIYMIDLLQAGAKSLQEGAETESTKKTEPNPAVTPESTNAAKDKPESKATTPESAGANTNPASKSPAKPLAKSAAQPAAKPVTQPAAQPTSQPAQQPAATESPVGFGAFLRDLSDYLNSSEYITEFMADSLRQARSIMAEVRGLIDAPTTADFRKRIESTREQINKTERQLEELHALRQNKWDGALEALSREIVQQVTEHTGAALPKLKTRLNEATEAWRETDESIGDLLKKRLQPILEEAFASSRKRSIELVDGACSKRNSGLPLSAEIVRRMDALGVSLDSVYPEYQPTMHKRLADVTNLPDIAKLQAALPIRKRFIDWLLFRSKARLNRILLGDNIPSEKPLTAAVKTKRIDAEGWQSFHEAIELHAQEAFATSLEAELKGLLEKYRELFQQRTRECLEAKLIELQQTLKSNRKEFELHKNIVESFDSMDQASAQLDERVSTLEDDFVPGGRIVDLPKKTTTQKSALPPGKPDKPHGGNPQNAGKSKPLQSSVDHK